MIAIPLESLFIIDYLLASGRAPVSRLRTLMAKEYELAEWGLEFSPQELGNCTTVKALIDRLHALYVRKHGKQVWGQKTPRFIRHGHLLKSIYPHARFVHLLRDPRAVVNSLIRSNSHRSNAYFASKRWQHDVQTGLELKEDYPEDVLEVQYEELVSFPEETLRQICGFLGVQFDSVMLDYHTGDPPGYKYYHSVPRVADPPDRDRIDAWRDCLSEAEISLIEAICGDTMDGLGYARDKDAPRVTPGYVWFLRLQRALGLVQQLAHYVRYRPRYLACVARRKAILYTPMKSLLGRGC